jgi:hypothetical protein
MIPGFPIGASQMAATTGENASSIEKRLLALEIDRGVSDKTKDLENRVRDLESMVRTARYVVSVCAGLITLVGIGVTAYVSSLTSTFQAANSKIDETKAFLQKADHDATTTQAQIAAQQASADKLTTETQEIFKKVDNLETELFKKLDNVQQHELAEAERLMDQVFGSIDEHADAALTKAASIVIAPILETQQKTSEDITSLNSRIVSLTNTMKGFVPISFTKDGCEIGTEIGILYALHDSNLNPPPPPIGFTLVGGPNAAGLTNHEWAQMHVCQWPSEP